jgi:hypothetical protein
MQSLANRVALVLIGVLAAAACSRSTTIPSVQPDASIVAPSDNSSILNRLKKDVVVGSTVDPENGDKGPHSVALVQTDEVLKKGELVVCNFADKSGAAGKGTTIEAIDPNAGSTKRFAQSSKIEGCAGVATSEYNNVYGAGLSSGVDAAFSPDGKPGKVYGAPLSAPFSDEDVRCVGRAGHCIYTAEYMFVSDAATGGVVSFSVNGSGHAGELQPVSGFAVNKKSGWSALGPSGLAYYYPADTLYVADGVDDTVVGITHASVLLVKDEVIVLHGGKTFKCKYNGKGDPCGKLIFSGAPLKAPEAMTVMPNGNLIVANTAGGNTLVEIDVSTGHVLATKVLNSSKKAAVFGLAAAGTSDSNTVLYYTDANTNELHKLEQ